MNKEIGERIRELRTSYCLSIDELAELLGVSSGFLGLIERGKRGITNQRLADLNKIFNVSMDYLILGHGDAPVKLSSNPIAFLENVLSEHELRSMDELGKKLSLHSFTVEEVNLLFDALYFKLKFFYAVKLKK